jgi:hypothetical protein
MSPPSSECKNDPGKKTALNTWPASNWFRVWLILGFGKWKPDVPLKGRLTFSGPEGITSEKIRYFITTAVTTVSSVALRSSFPLAWTCLSLASTVRPACLAGLLRVNRSVFLVTGNLTTQHLSSYIPEIQPIQKTYTFSSAKSNLINCTVRQHKLLYSFTFHVVQL